MKSLWMTYKGVELWRTPSGYSYTTSRMKLDADGAPNAYGPADSGLDYLKNAGYPGSHWGSVLTPDPADPRRPYVQQTGPTAGFYVSRTSLEDTSHPPTVPARYVDATRIPYIVFPGEFYALKGTGSLGDLAMCRSLANGLSTAAVVADRGPADAPLGEVSLALAAALGGRSPNPRTGAGQPAGPFQYVIFPGSRHDHPWPLTPAALDAAANATLAAAGGWGAF